MVCSSHLVTTALPPVQQTIVCTLVFKPPNAPGPTGAPTGRARWERAGQEPCLCLCSPGSGTWNKMGDQQRAGGAIGRGQERPVHLPAPSGRSRGWLSVCVALVCQSLTVFLLSVCHCLSCYCACRLEATGIRPPRLLTCGLKKGAEGPEFRVECRALSQGVGGWGCWCQTTCLLCPWVWVAGSAPSIARGDSLDQAPRSVGGAGKVLFRVGALSIPLPVSPQQRSRYRLSALRLFACASRRVEQTAGGQSGAAQVGKTVARRAACSCGRS